MGGKRKGNERPPKKGSAHQPTHSLSDDGLKYLFAKYAVS